MLEGMAREIQAEGILCGTSVKHGYAGDAICAEIRRTGAGRLIMGTHGRRKAGEDGAGLGGERTAYACRDPPSLQWVRTPKASPNMWFRSPGT